MRTPAQRLVEAGEKALETLEGLHEHDDEDGHDTCPECEVMRKLDRAIREVKASG